LFICPRDWLHVRFCPANASYNCLRDYNSSYCGPYSAALLPHLTKRPPHISHVRLMLPRFVRSVTWCSFIADGCGAITIYQTFSSLAYCGWLSAHRRPDVVGLIQRSFGTGSFIMWYK
jgi:hypothetical protein